jgi:hypothetical protein
MASLILKAANGLCVRFDVTGRATFYYDLPSLDPYSSYAYVLLHMKAAYQRDNWSAETWFRHVTNCDYTVPHFYFGDVPPDFPMHQSTQLGKPRQFGLTLGCDSAAARAGRNARRLAMRWRALTD